MIHISMDIFCKSSVSVARKLSKEVISSMVPQGSVLGSLLFLVHVNFITSNVLGSWTAFSDGYSRNSLDDREESMRKL